MIRYNIIAALDEDTNGIGFQSKLPWNIPEDLQRFKNITLNSNVIMGRKTWQSIPHSYLKNRINIVITKNSSLKKENIVFVSSFDEALEKCDPSKQVFVIGGESVYKEAISRRNCKKLYLTLINTINRQNYDTFFPSFEKNFKTIEVRTPNRYKDHVYTFTEWIPNLTQNPEEERYLEIMEVMIKTQTVKNRTEVPTYTLFGLTLRFDLSNETLPLQTTRRMWFKGIFEEFKWILSGSTNALELAEKGVNIWLGNTTREFLDSRALYHYEVGDIGPTYGFNMRHYGAEYKGMKENYKGQGVDQLENAIGILKTNPTSRRIIIDLWDPRVIHQTALPPCMFCYTFHYNGKLNLHVNQRSSDFFLARNWNDVFASLLLLYVAKRVGMEPGELVVTITNSHIYQNHLEQVKIQIQRKPRPFPKFILEEDLSYSLEEYHPYPSIKAEMVV